MKTIIHVDDYGRSPLICNSILKSIAKGNVTRVSVMVGLVPEVFHTRLKETGCSIRLHLNLTEGIEITHNNITTKLSLARLVLLRQKLRKHVFNIIDYQISEFIKLYDPEEILVDGHQHAHFIPWIYDYLINLKNPYLSEIRYPIETIQYIHLSDILKTRYIRNLLGLLFLWFLSFYNKNKRYDCVFYGMLYSDIYDREVFLDQLSSNSTKPKEILLHPGGTNEEEYELFEDDFFKFYSSNNRKKEFKVTLL